MGLYASLIGVIDYHQTGVEAVKKAAASILEFQGKVLAALTSDPYSAEQIANKIGDPEDVETVSLLLEHLGANGRARTIDAPDGSPPKYSRP